MHPDCTHCSGSKLDLVKSNSETLQSDELLFPQYKVNIGALAALLVVRPSCCWKVYELWINPIVSVVLLGNLQLKMHSTNHKNRKSNITVSC